VPIAPVERNWPRFLAADMDRLITAHRGRIYNPAGVSAVADFAVITSNRPTPTTPLGSHVDRNYVRHALR